MPDDTVELPDANKIIQEEEEKIANKAKSTVFTVYTFCRARYDEKKGSSNEKNDENVENFERRK